MARQRRTPKSVDAGWQDRHHRTAGAALRPTEGKLVDNRDELTDEELVWISERYQEKCGAEPTLARRDFDTMRTIHVTRQCFGKAFA